MENKLEQLLNSLIEKGWKPRGLETKRFDGEMYYAEIFEHYSNGTMFFDGVEYSIRQLVSKESGLWQFVCENYLIELNGDEIEKKYKSEGEYPLRYEKHYGVYHSDLCRQEFIKYETPEFWIIESALCDEDKLEEFLISNIKVDD